MIDKTALYIKHDDNGSYSDYSHKAKDFERDTFTITLDSATGYLYVGYHKPIHTAYFNCKTSGYSEASLTLEYFDGSTWSELEASDDTYAFMRADFIRWENPTDIATTEVDGKSAYWYRFQPSESRVDLEFKGINLVFANDYDLSTEMPYITDTSFLGTEDSHIKIHVAVRDAILNKFSRIDYYKINDDGDREAINAWDLHSIGEIKQAAVKLALSKIYKYMSDEEGDEFDYKSKQYWSEYDRSISVARLSLDTNDDGLKQSHENKPSFKLRRISR